jgi:hypothetical protein
MIAERLGQARDSALINKPPTQRVGFVRRDEDNRHAMSAAFQFALQVGTRHCWHRNIGDQAFRFFGRTRTQEIPLPTRMFRRHSQPLSADLAVTRARIRRRRRPTRANDPAPQFLTTRIPAGASAASPLQTPVKPSA